MQQIHFYISYISFFEPRRRTRFKCSRQPSDGALARPERVPSVPLPEDASPQLEARPSQKKRLDTKKWDNPIMLQYLLQVGFGCLNNILLGIWSTRDLSGVGYGLVPWRVRVLAHLLRMASWNVNYFALRFGDCTPLHYPLTFGGPGCLGMYKDILFVPA